MATHYTKDHEWIRLDGDVATVGITEHAQNALGDIVYVELPEIGRAVEKGGEAAVVESVKAASDVYAPASGEDEAGTVIPPSKLHECARLYRWSVKAAPLRVHFKLARYECATGRSRMLVEMPLLVIRASSGIPCTVRRS